MWASCTSSTDTLSNERNSCWLSTWLSLVVWKLDRFGRSLVHCASGIQELASLGIRFIATSQGLDTDESNPASKLLMHILAAVAQFERELIRERVAATWTLDDYDPAAG